MSCAIVGVSRNENDIADIWVRHHLAEGVAGIYLADASTDGTKEILRGFPEITALDDTNEFCLQAEWTNRLAAMAADDGHTWVLPVDLDEFVYSVDGDTIGNTLAKCEHDKLYVRAYEQQDWSARYVQPHYLNKVAYRWSPAAQVTMGNHEVTILGGMHDVLALRELKYRSWEHFLRKTRERNETLDPSARARGEAWHHQILQNKNEQELQIEWQQMQAREKIADPIPSRIRLG